jgi:hypothetical protein
MKWILFSALTLVLPMYAAQEKATPAYCDPECDDCDPDLFKKDAPIYSGRAEFLYWTVAEGALDYALKMEHPASDPAALVYAQGKFQNGSYGFDPGFRLSLNYYRAPHRWEMTWQYTRMTSRGHDTVHKPATDGLYLTGTWPQIFSGPITKATSHLHLNYNVFDWLVDRVFIPNPHLKLRLIGGAFTAWMDQEWKIHYYNASSLQDTIKNKWKYAGGGLKMGSVFDWYIYRDFYLTGYGIFGLAIGSYSNHSKQTEATLLRDAHYEDIRPAFTIQLALGPSWQKNYSKHRIEVYAGFEMNPWFNLQEVFRSTSSTSDQAKETWVNTGTLTLYGVTTRITLDF